MTVGIEAYRCAVGQFAPILVTLLLKKVVKTSRKVHDSEVFTGEVCSGTDIAVFFAWLVLSTTLLFSAPFCVHMVLCGDLYTAKHSMYDSFLLIPNANRLCDAMQTDLLLDSGVSAFSTMTLQQTGPLVPHPPPNLRFLLLLCGDIEPHPGPTRIEDSVKCLETKVDSQAERLEGKLNQLIDMMNTTQSHNKQLERNFQKLEESISANNEQIQLQFSLLKDSVSALQSAVRRNNEQLDSIGNEQNSMSSRLRKLEEEVERQERYSRRSNVLLYGMKEEAGESFDRCTARVIKTLRRHFPQKDWNETDVERAHRLGPLSRKSDRPRPVIIKFQRWRDAMIIMRDKEGKNLMRDSDGLRVGADLTKQQRDTLSQLRNQGKHAYFAKGKLVVQESRPHPNRFNSRSTHDQNPTKHAPPLSPHAVQSRQNSIAAFYAEAAAAPPRTRDGTSPPLDSWTEQMEDAALEEDPADDQPSDEECEVPAHRSSSVGDGAEPPVSGPSASPAVSMDHSPRPRGFGRGTPTGTTEQNTVSRSGGSGGRGRGRPSSADLQARGNPRCQSLSSPMLTRNRSHSSTSSSSRQGRLPSAWHHTGSGPAGARDSSPVGESAGNNDRDTHRRK